MTTVLRSVPRCNLRAVAAALTLSFVLGVGAVAAASPAPGLGGRLSNLGASVSVYNGGTIPAHVTLWAEVVTLDTTPFVLAPGETREVPFTGKPRGDVSASMTGVPGPGAGDTNTVVLSLTLRPYVPPFDWTPVGGGTIVITALALIARRLKPWKWRIVTTPAA